MADENRILHGDEGDALKYVAEIGNISKIRGREREKRRIACKWANRQKYADGEKNDTFDVSVCSVIAYDARLWNFVSDLQI